MTDQIPMPTEHPTVVVLQTVFGATYGTVQVHLGVALREAPVRFGAEQAVGDYGLRMVQAAPALLPQGAQVRALLGGSGQGPFHELPDLEIFIGSSDQTVGEYFVAQGWAIPCAALLEHHARHQRYLEALRQARLHHAGIWGETGITASAIGLSPDLDAATRPAQGTPAWAVEAAITVLLVLALLIGSRGRQTREQATPPDADAERTARRRSIPGGRLVGRALGFYFGGLLPPRRPSAPRASVPASAPPAAAAAPCAGAVPPAPMPTLPTSPPGSSA